MAEGVTIRLSLRGRRQVAKGLEDTREDIEEIGDEAERTGKRTKRGMDNATDAMIRSSIASRASIGGWQGIALAAGFALDALLPATGAVAALPSMLFAGGAGATALIVGLKGVGDVISEEDPEKYAEMLKGLHPEAAKTVQVLRDLKDEWKTVKLATQGALFAGTGAVISDLAGTYLPMLEVRLGGIANAWNDMFKQMAGLMLEGDRVKDFNTLLFGTEQVIGGLAPGFAAILAMFIDLSAVGMTFLPSWSRSFSEAAIGASEFISNARETGQIAEWIQTGVDVLKDLWTVLITVADAAMDTISPFMLGSNALSYLADNTDLVRGAVQVLLPLWVSYRLTMLAVAAVSAVMTARTMAMSAAQGVATAAQWALNAAMSANPLALVVLALAAVVAGLIVAYRNSETFRNFVDRLWASIKRTKDDVVKFAAVLMAQLSGASKTAGRAVKGVSDFVGGLADKARGAVRWVKDLAEKMKNLPGAGAIGKLGGMLGFAEGGIVRPSMGTVLVGEEGPELIRVSAPSQVIPAEPTRQLLEGPAPIPVPRQAADSENSIHGWGSTITPRVTEEHVHVHVGDREFFEVWRDQAGNWQARR